MLQNEHGSVTSPLFKGSFDRPTEPTNQTTNRQTWEFMVQGSYTSNNDKFIFKIRYMKNTEMEIQNIRQYISNMYICVHILHIFMFHDASSVTKKQTRMLSLRRIRLKPEKLYIREFASGNLRENWSQGYCVQTALNTSFALLSQLEIRRQLCVCFDSAVKSSRRRTTCIISTIIISLYFLCFLYFSWKLWTQILSPKSSPGRNGGAHQADNCHVGQTRLKITCVNINYHSHKTFIVQ